MAYIIVDSKPTAVPTSIVCFLPILSEIMPVGSSKMAELRNITEKTLMPKVYEPDTLEKYKIATGANKLKSVKKFQTESRRIVLRISKK